MGAITEMSSKEKSAPKPLSFLSEFSSPLLFVALLLFATIHIASLWFHEPWADEIQAFLLARDSGLWELLSQRLKYEATPGLWHTLLWFGTRFSTEITVLQLLSVTIATISCALILFASPFPWLLRIALPFTYFLGYQYSIVARNYCVTTLATILAAMAYRRRLESPGYYVLCLLVLAHSSSHGLLMAAGFAFCDLLPPGKLKSKVALLKLSPVFIIGMLLSLAQFFPLPEDYEFNASRGGVGIIYQDATVWKCLDEGFVGLSVLTPIVLLSSLVMFYRCQLLALYLVPSGLLLLLFQWKHWALWHSGTFFLVWFFCLYQCYYEQKGRTDATWWKTVLALFCLVSMWQTALTVQQDLSQPYFGLHHAARDIKFRNIDINDIEPVNYYPHMVYGYFPPERGHPGYWKWSIHHKTWTKPEPPKYILGAAATVGEAMSEYFVPQKPGYRLLQVYPGTRPWKGRKLFSISSFALYERESETTSNDIYKEDI